jgi:hypothetical protein
VEGIRITPKSEEGDRGTSEDVVSGGRVGIRNCGDVLVGGNEGRGWERLEDVGGYIK